MSEIKDLLSDIKEILKDLYKDRLKQVILYGSYARNEQREDSDIDLAIIIQGDIHPFEEIDRIVDKIYDFELEHNVLFSIHPISYDKFENNNNIFLANVKEEGVSI